MNESMNLTQDAANHFFALLRNHGWHHEAARRKAVDAERFSREECQGVFCVPSKLRMVSARQDFIKEHLHAGASLFLDPWNGEIQVLYRNRVVGIIGRQNTPWLSALMAGEVGVECHVKAITGGTEDKPHVGVNVCLLVAPALDAYRFEQARLLRQMAERQWGVPSQPVLHEAVAA